jgi:carboxypeptidase C (cathepsin A)
MLYVDEPIGTGFSYGTDTVVGTVSAAPFVWKLLQAFFAQFPEYECRDFGLFTESYGTYWGAKYFLFEIVSGVFALETCLRSRWYSRILPNEAITNSLILVGGHYGPGN